MTNALDAATDGLLSERRSSPGLLLAVLGHHAMHRLRGAHTHQGLSPRQFLLLALLADLGATGQRELGQALHVDPSVLVTLLNPLEERGLIARSRSAADRRRHLVSLTAAGERALHEAAEAQRRVEDELFAGLEEDSREQLRGLLIQLRESLQPACPGEAAAECSAQAASWDSQSRYSRL